MLIHATDDDERRPKRERPGDDNTNDALDDRLGELRFQGDSFRLVFERAYARLFINRRILLISPGEEENFVSNFEINIFKIANCQFEKTIRQDVAVAGN